MEASAALTQASSLPWTSVLSLICVVELLLIPRALSLSAHCVSVPTAYSFPSDFMRSLIIRPPTSGMVTYYQCFPINCKLSEV